MAKNTDSKKIQELNKQIVDADSYTILNHEGKKVEMTGKKLKEYMLVMRNVIDFTELETELKTQTPAEVAKPTAKGKKEIEAATAE